MRPLTTHSFTLLALLCACNGSPAGVADVAPSPGATERADASSEADGATPSSRNDLPAAADLVEVPTGPDARELADVATLPDASAPSLDAPDVSAPSLDVSVMPDRVAPAQDVLPSLDASTATPDAPTALDGATDAAMSFPDVGDVPTTPAMMRLRYPASHTRVTRHRLTLAWANGRGDGAQVTLCRDRSCTRPVTTFYAAGGSAAVPAPLTPGTYFWFAEGRAQGAPTGERSATWHFRVGPRDTAVDTAQPDGMDFNNDGYSDLLLQGAELPNPRARVFPGGATGPSEDRVWVVERYVRAVADIDGDGCSDLVLDGEIWFGDTEGTFTRRARQVELDRRVVIPMGDVDLDGYQDVITLVDERPAYLIVAYLRRGGPEGLSATSTMLPRLPDPFSDSLNLHPLFDLDGDRRPELGLSSYLNGGIARAWTVCSTDWRWCGPGATGERLASMASAGDLDGDGYGDVVTWSLNAPDFGGQTRVFVFHPGHGVATPLSVPAATTWVSSLGDINGDGCDELAFMNEPGTSTTLRWSPCGGTPRPDQLLASPSGVAAFWGGRDVNGDGFDDVLVGSVSRTSLRLGAADGLTVTEIPILR